MTNGAEFRALRRAEMAYQTALLYRRRPWLMPPRPQSLAGIFPREVWHLIEARRLRAAARSLGVRGPANPRPGALFSAGWTGARYRATITTLTDWALQRQTVFSRVANYDMATFLGPEHGAIDPDRHCTHLREHLASVIHGHHLNPCEAVIGWLRLVVGARTEDAYHAVRDLNDVLTWLEPGARHLQAGLPEPLSRLVFAAWLEECADNELWPLAFAAGLDPDEFFLQQDTGTVDEASLTTLAALRGYVLPPIPDRRRHGDRH